MPGTAPDSSFFPRVHRFGILTSKNASDIPEVTAGISSWLLVTFFQAVLVKHPWPEHKSVLSLLGIGEEP